MLLLTALCFLSFTVTHIKMYNLLIIFHTVIFVILLINRGRMYQKKNIRVYIAWMLFMTFIPFFVVKTFHYHGSEDEKSCSHAGHSHKSSEDCAICQYSLSFFTEPQPVEFHCTLTLVPYEPVVYQDKVVCKRTYSHQLRAPPVA